MLSDLKQTTCHVFAFTQSGMTIKTRLCEALGHSDDNVKTQVAKAFLTHTEDAPQVLIFIGAVGIAVRFIAPHLKDKLTDPPVIVIDDLGRCVIPILSGHFGKANEIALVLSTFLKQSGYEARPVITTATDNRGHKGFETLIHHYKLDKKKVLTTAKTFNTTIANMEEITLYVDPRIKASKPIENYPKLTWVHSKEALLTSSGLKVAITLDDESYPDNVFVCYSKSLVLGTGCKKGTDAQWYLKNLKDFLKSQHLSEKAIGTIASIDLKSEENAILKAAETLEATCIFFSPKELLALEGLFQGSDFVKKTTGIHAVAGPSAYDLTHDDWCFNVFKRNGCTFSIGRITL